MMKMKAILAGMAGLALASSAHAATINYVLSLNDNGTGTVTAGNYAVYAYLSGTTLTGTTSGLASFTITTTGQATTINRSPQATFAADDGFSDNKTSGYTALRSAGSSGVATTGSFDTVSGNGIPEYGIGQVAGTVRDNAPVGYTASSSVAQGAYGVTNSFTVANAGGVATPTGGAIPVLLASGTYVGVPNISLGAGNILIGSGFTTEAATITTTTRDLSGNIPEPASLALIGLAGVGMMARRRKAETATV